MPNIATVVKNNNVADTKPTENTINSFLLNFSSIILVVNTLPQNTIVIGLDNVKIIPCINALEEFGFKFSPGIILISNTFKIIFSPNIIKTIAPTIFTTFSTFSFPNNLLAPKLANKM